MKTPLRFFLSLALFITAASTVLAADRDGLSEGQAAFNAGNYELAFAKWSELATTGHPEAQVFIGLSYANGWGVERNPKLASLWYQKAANNENPSGQFLLGLYYISSADKQEASTGLMWLHRAEANGDDSAKRFLKRAYERGWFKDLEPAQTPTQSTVPEKQRVAAVTPPESR